MLSPHPQLLSFSFSLKPPLIPSPSLVITLTLIHSLTHPYVHSLHVMEGGITYEGAFFAMTMKGGLIYEQC